ncbi:hypothetical protein DP68_16180 [Clostridium sp. HMP27]|nr:hypothetical protein DP68_16180 [Clostridium sp. HMP27]
MPLTLFLVTYAVQALFQKYILPTFELSITIIMSTINTLLITKITMFNTFFIKYEEFIIVTLSLISFVCLAVILYRKRDDFRNEAEDKDELFNLFYINTSKVHEIAMLIDNKIMKTVEKERNTQQILKSNFSMNFNKPGISGTSVNHATENSNKTSVYESFDVKTTKSIMLRTIYSSIIKRDSNKEELGNILLFRNIELKQRNTDDTVMVLNVLKDGNMKQFSKDDNFELNLSKMMDEMLDDFTIDYTFDHNNNNYLIRIPYKSKEYFENSYSHNDLQLGKLSVIGIYRGEIDFSTIDSISSKFLELFSESYKDELSRNNRRKRVGLLQSSSTEVEKDYELKIEHNKLKGLHHLIDLIAIIQEINIKDGGFSE